MLILQIVELPFAFYQGFLLEHRYGLSTQSRRHWLADQAKGVALGLVLAIAGTSVVYLDAARVARRLVVDLGGGVRGGDGRPGAARAGGAAADLLQVQAARSSGARRAADGAGDAARAPTSSACSSGC